MSELLQMLQAEMGPQGLGPLSALLGSDPGSTQKAVSAALPAILGALERNSNASPEGAEALSQALKRDHQEPLPSQGMDMASILSSALQGTGGKALQGEAILGHLFGNRTQEVQGKVAKASGADPSQVQKLLPMLAPLVMSTLGSIQAKKGLDSKGLAQFLSQEKQEMKSQQPAGILGLLDLDGDGSVLDEVAELGGKLFSGGMLGSLFGGSSE